MRDTEAAEVDAGAADGEQQRGEQRDARAAQLAREQIGARAPPSVPISADDRRSVAMWTPNSGDEQALQRQADHRPGVPAHAEEVRNAAAGGRRSSRYMATRGSSPKYVRGSVVEPQQSRQRRQQQHGGSRDDLATLHGGAA